MIFRPAARALTTFRLWTYALAALWSYPPLRCAPFILLAVQALSVFIPRLASAHHAPEHDHDEPYDDDNEQLQERRHN